MALLSALLTWFILAFIGRAEHRIGERRAASGDAAQTRGEVQWTPKTQRSRWFL